MPSERQLHPATILFGLIGQLREFAVPILFVLVAGSSRGGPEAWALILLIPYSLLAVARYYSYRYRFDDTELVIRSGIISTNVRHIPYARIQNLDATQNVFHRMFGVLSARVDTGSGHDAEATLSVITRAAYEEIRERVFRERRGVEPGDEAAGPRADELLRLPTRELVIHGLIENRGMIVIAGLLGLFFQSGMDERLYQRLAQDSEASRSALRSLAAQVTEMAARADGIVVGIVLVLVALALVRVLSVAIAVVRLHHFRLTRVGEDLRAEYGMLTRVTSTIPLRRVQTVTVSAGLLHRGFGRASVRVDTAGGDGAQVQRRGRESLAPIIRSADVPALLHAVLPELRLDAIDWRPAAHGATGRAFRKRLAVSGVLSLALIYPIGWYALAAFAALAGVSWFTAAQYVRSLGWATVDGAVLHRSGYLARHMSVARFSRIQAVSILSSPFDRRRRMARVNVDTAGASGSPHRVHIPYVEASAAEALHRELAAAAGQTAFHW
jgi:putative membrane protein